MSAQQEIDLRAGVSDPGLADRVDALEAQNLSLARRLESALEEIASMAERAAAAETLIAQSRAETAELMQFIESAHRKVDSTHESVEGIAQRARLAVPVANHQDLELAVDTLRETVAGLVNAQPPAV